MDADTLSRTIHIKGLNPSITKEKLTDSLSISGPIENIQISGSEALVTFSNVDAAENSLMLDNTFVGGSQITVENATILAFKEEEKPLIANKKEEELIPKEVLKQKEPEKKIETIKEVESKESKAAKLKIAMDYCNVPARCALEKDDLICAVFNKKYWVTVFALWSIYLIFMNLFQDSN